ncbi:hypothetical protein ACMD2_16090, partial [Ananas comosus]
FVQKSKAKSQGVEKFYNLELLGSANVNELVVMLSSQVEFELLPYNTKFSQASLSVTRLTLDHRLVGVPWIRYA